MPTKPTDWCAYYDKPFWAARYTRRITTRVLLGAIRRHAPRGGQGMVVAELGGAGSCFHRPFMAALAPREYHVLDNHRPGLDKMSHCLEPGASTFLHETDVLDCQVKLQADLVFSAGLIEHFDAQGMARAVAAHFRLAAPQGLVIITFPTPTWLYRAARRLAEATGIWIFHDERPLSMEEVIKRVAGLGEILEQGIIWPIVYTQGMVIVKSGLAAAAFPPR
ncbi:MAG: class I SAM-dependent methyltransferase [Desulfarculus sp.]|nr:class I SAM-dependent methyltransferase [Desulfarculus sp.]